MKVYYEFTKYEEVSSTEKRGNRIDKQHTIATNEKDDELGRKLAGKLQLHEFSFMHSRVIK